MTNFNFDEILTMVGDFGRTQFILLVLFCVINILSAFHYFGQTIISVIPGHQCNLANENDEVLQFKQCSAIISDDNNGTMESICRSWTYDTTNIYGFRGIVEDLNWICDNSWKPAFGQSLFFIGSVLGTLILGYFADKIGRVIALIIANSLVILGTYVTLISSDLYIFSFGRFLAGAATDTNFVMMYIIVLEYLRPSLRTSGLNICIGIFYCMACMVVPWIAVLLHNWKYFLLFVATPHFLVISYWFLVPESAQWLISKGNIEAAILSFKKIAKMNKRLIKEDLLHDLRVYGSQTCSVPKQENFFGLLKTPNLRRKTIILIFKSMVMTLCYDTISRNVNGLDASPFLIFSVGSATILPACLLITVLQDRVGRKALASGSFFLSAICTSISGLTQVFVETPSPTVIITLAVIARFAINIAYNSGAQYAVELIPTVVRGQGVSFIHVAGYAASFFSPHILYLGTFWRPTPEIILGVLLIMGSIACLFLPETLDKTLPISLEDGENFGEDERIFEFACCKKISSSTVALNPGINETCYL